MWQTLGKFLFVVACFGAVWFYFWNNDPQRVHDRKLRAKQEREARRLRAKELRS